MNKKQVVLSTIIIMLLTFIIVLLFLMQQRVIELENQVETNKLAIKNLIQYLKNN